MNKESLANMIRGQERSTGMWCAQFTKNRDISSRINAAMALGRLNGMLRVYLSVCAEKNATPDPEIESLMLPYDAVWEDVQKLA